jgi:hypothetical protein
MRDQQKQRAAKLRHYYRNRAHYRAKAKEQRVRIRAFLNSLKDFPCVDCGRKYPAPVMEFHHRHRKAKDINLSWVATAGWGETRIRTEVSKCDLLCANCHRLREYGLRSGTTEASKTT